jgi:preprotein translocase subunit SecG
MLVLALIGVVLLQKSEGGALGMGGGGGGLMSSRGTANVLTRTTAILGAGFFATSVLLAILAGKATERPSSIIDKAATSAPATPTAPAAPAGSGGGILDTLQQMQKGGQTAPAKPAGQ